MMAHRLRHGLAGVESGVYQVLSGADTWSR
jgi:hypothetical protein